MEPVIAATYSFKIRLSDVAGGFKLTPTLAAGDFKISTSSIASGALTNLTNLPTETPAGSGIVVISLTAAEMADGDPIVTWKDQTTPQEWVEGYSFIDTRPSLATIDTVVDGIAAKTVNLPSDPADASVISARFDTVDTSIAAVNTKTTNLPSDPADASVIAARFDTVDTSIAAVNTKTTNLPSDPADQSLIMAAIAAIPSADGAAILAAIAALNDISVSDILDASNGVETSITPRQALRLILSANAGIVSGAETTTVTFRNVGNSKNRIVATVDESGNRSAVTTDVT